ncbi:hypothetical protein F0344_26625 [Streptomyces finlayi]|uniref:DUF5753 domain-containing protein n=2 Tax=Streptomyces finlayi TaxID=67296 RepID=A0A7G7BQT0_9ACTN|nr:hypothetical protein F0344_26625 [Streptomyces finlayi]
MLEQLDSLIEDEALHAISLRVVPFTAPVPPTHPLHLLEFGGADEKPLTAFDSMTGMTFQKRPRDVRENRYYIEAMRQLALNTVESRAMIETGGSADGRSGHSPRLRFALLTFAGSPAAPPGRAAVPLPGRDGGASVGAPCPGPGRSQSR